MVIDERTAGPTFTDVLALTEPEVAEIVREPRATAVASPLPTIEATLLFEEAQATDAVISLTL